MTSKCSKNKIKKVAIAEYVTDSLSVTRKHSEQENCLILSLLSMFFKKIYLDLNITLKCS